MCIRNYRHRPQAFRPTAHQILLLIFEGGFAIANHRNIYYFSIEILTKP